MKWQRGDNVMMWEAGFLIEIKKFVIGWYFSFLHFWIMQQRCAIPQQNMTIDIPYIFFVFKIVPNLIIPMKRIGPTKTTSIFSLPCGGLWRKDPQKWHHGSDGNTLSIHGDAISFATSHSGSSNCTHGCSPPPAIMLSNLFVLGGEEAAAQLVVLAKVQGWKYANTKISSLIFYP